MATVYLIFIYFPKLVCKTIKGPASNIPCVFPFKVRWRNFYWNWIQVVHNECTWKGDTSLGAWCSTKVDANGKHIRGNWGACGPNCPMPG